MRITRRGFLALVGSLIGGLATSGVGYLRALGQPIYEEWGDVPAASGLTGIVVDILTGQPLAGTAVSAMDASSATVVARATTLASGEFSLDVPDGEYEVSAHADGYVVMSMVRQRVVNPLPTLVGFRMIPLEVSPEDEERLYDAVVTIPESPLEDIPVPEGGFAPDGVQPSVTVPETIVVRFADGHQETMALDDYLKGVVPSEMPSSWNMEALKAQAVAARSYALVYYLSHGYVCTTTTCQVYGSARYASTNQAVDATHNEIGIYNGSIISAFFYTRCNGSTTRNSENALGTHDGWLTCYNAPWNYVAYCRAVSCGGHAPGSSSCGYTGHGVGMCQYGAKAKADSPSNWNYRQIISHYYTGVTVQGGIDPPIHLSPGDGALFQSGTPVTLTWS